MNNKEFISTLAQRTGTTQQLAQKMCSSIVEALLTEVEQKEEVHVPDFGMFEVKKRLERILVNPNSGRKMLVPPKLILSFKPTQALKDNLQKGGMAN